MGTHPGPTVETQGSIVLAEKPAEVNTRPKAPPPAPSTPRSLRPVTPDRTGFQLSSFPASVGSFKIFLYFKFLFECHYISFPTNTFHVMSHCIAFQFEFQDTSVLQVFSVS